MDEQGFCFGVVKITMSCLTDQRPVPASTRAFGFTQNQVPGGTLSANCHVRLTSTMEGLLYMRRSGSDVDVQPQECDQIALG